MQVQVVGVKKMEYMGRDSKSKIGFNYYGLKSFTKYEEENTACEGCAVITEFSNEDYNIHPGDIVEFVYEPGYQGKASLVNVLMLKMGEKPPFKVSDVAGTGQETADSKPEDPKRK